MDQAGTALLADGSAAIAQTRRKQRARLLEEIAAGRIQPQESGKLLEGLLWLDRIGYHLWRTMHHLQTSAAGEATAAAAVLEPQ